jgi:molybdate transport system permease protein
MNHTPPTSVRDTGIRIPASGRRIPGPPRSVVAAGIVAAAVAALPICALLADLTPAAVTGAVTDPAVVESLWRSLRTSTPAAVLAVAVGAPIAHLLAADIRGSWLLRPIATVPLVLPPVVSGLALLTALGRRGRIGSTLHALGFDIAFSTAAVVVAQAFVALPFVVVSLEGSLRARGRRHELAAHALGMSPARVFWTVSAPLSVPALATAGCLAWARALGEFGATVTFAGSLPGVTRTLPLHIYLARETDPASAVALASLLIAAALLLVVTSRAITRLTARFAL